MPFAAALPVGITITLAAVLAGALLASLTPRARRRYSSRWIRDLRAPITAELRSTVEDSRWHQFVGSLAGGMVGICLLLPTSLGMATADATSSTLIVGPWFAPIVGVAIGRGLGGLTSAGRDVSGSVRMARPWEPRLTDDVRRTGLTAVRLQMIVILLATTFFAGWLMRLGVHADPWQSVALWGSLAVLVAIWIGSELSARRLVARPLAGADAATLFWRDALRGELLRGLFLLPPAVGLLAPTAIFSSLSSFRGTPAAAIGPDLVMAASLLVLALGLAAQLSLQRAPANPRHRTLLIAAQRSLENA